MAEPAGHIRRLGVEYAMAVQATIQDTKDQSKVIGGANTTIAGGYVWKLWSLKSVFRLFGSELKGSIKKNNTF